MMYSRLRLAKNLLREDGVIAVSIDDNEIHHLRLLMNEIFGENNFLAQVVVQSNKRGQTYKQISKTHEYILIYTRHYQGWCILRIAVIRNRRAHAPVSSYR
jgi:adenine-specific DNA-methyltransferase